MSDPCNNIGTWNFHGGTSGGQTSIQADAMSEKQFSQFPSPRVTISISQLKQLLST